MRLSGDAGREDLGNSGVIQKPANQSGWEAPLFQLSYEPSSDNSRGVALTDSGQNRLSQIVWNPEVVVFTDIKQCPLQLFIRHRCSAYPNEADR
jgi:hypothetical protein